MESFIRRAWHLILPLIPFSIVVSASAYAPEIKNVSAMCSSEGITAFIQFDAPFAGKIYSLEYANVHDCLYYNSLQMDTVLFSIPANRCGTKLSRSSRNIIDQMENRVYVQMDKDTQTSADKQFSFVCQLSNAVVAPTAASSDSRLSPTISSNKDNYAVVPPAVDTISTNRITTQPIIGIQMPVPRISAFSTDSHFGNYPIPGATPYHPSMPPVASWPQQFVAGPIVPVKGSSPTISASNDYAVRPAMQTSYEPPKIVPAPVAPRPPLMPVSAVRTSHPIPQQNSYALPPILPDTSVRRHPIIPAITMRPHQPIVNPSYYPTRFPPLTPSVVEPQRQDEYSFPRSYPPKSPFATIETTTSTPVVGGWSPTDDTYSVNRNTVNTGSATKVVARPWNEPIAAGDTDWVRRTEAKNVSASNSINVSASVSRVDIENPGGSWRTITSQQPKQEDYETTTTARDEFFYTKKLDETTPPPKSDVAASSDSAVFRRPTALFASDAEANSINARVSSNPENLVTTMEDFAPETKAALEIQEGEGPHAPLVSRPIKIGDNITLVVKAKSQMAGPESFDMFTHSCFATDGPGKTRVDLIDQNGCVLRPEFVGQLQRVRDPTGMMYYFFRISAFKFPGPDDVYFSCSISITPFRNAPEICATEDPSKETSGRTRRDADVNTMRLFDAVKVELEEKYRKEEIVKDSLESFCIESTQLYLILFILLTLLLGFIATTSVSILFYMRLKRLSAKDRESPDFQSQRTSVYSSYH